MNQPRYSDSGGVNNSWHSSNSSSYNGNHRGGGGVAHATGRSNYGGSSYRGRGKKEGNPIGKWIQNRRQRRRQRRSAAASHGAVGTEANAIANMARNAKHFSYPTEGFVTPIEHSLLYAMIEFPERYPETVVKKEIEEEEFDVYLYVNDPKRKAGAAATDDGGGTSDNNTTREGAEGVAEENDEERSDQAQNAQDGRRESGGAAYDDEERVSYAQLSALAALSAEKNPAKATPESNNADAANGSRTGGRDNPRNNGGGNPPVAAPTALSIGQTLVRKLLRTITRYSDALDLDRQHEIREFLSPIERRCQLRNEKAALQQLLPAYAGYTLSLVTGNPLPLLIGAAALTQPDPMMDENSNVSGFRAVGGRAGDMETAGLLDELESD